MLQKNFPNKFSFISRSCISYFWFKADKFYNPALVIQAINARNIYRILTQNHHNIWSRDTIRSIQAEQEN